MKEIVENIGLENIINTEQGEIENYYDINQGRPNENEEEELLTIEADMNISPFQNEYVHDSNNQPAN